MRGRVGIHSLGDCSDIPMILDPLVYVRAKPIRDVTQLAVIRRVDENCLRIC